MIKERHSVDPDEILKSWTLGSCISFFSFFEFITFLTPWLFRPLQFLRLLFFSGFQNVKSGFFYHIDDRQNGQQLLNAIWNIWIRIIKSIWMTNYAKIANHGQNLKFHFLVKKWLSLGEFLRKKNRKSWKHVFYTNWTILSRKKNFFEKKILNDPKSRKSAINKIFWTASQNLLIFSGMIALDSAFQHIIPVCPGKIKKFYKKLKNAKK